MSMQPKKVFECLTDARTHKHQSLRTAILLTVSMREATAPSLSASLENLTASRCFLTAACRHTQTFVNVDLP